MNDKDGSPPASPQAPESQLGSSAKSSSPEIDCNYKYRNMVLLLIAIFFLVRLLFFPKLLTGVFMDTSKTLDFSILLRVRGFYLLITVAVYWLSYFKDWYFARVSLTVATLALTSLVIDVFNFYTLIVGPIPPVVGFGIACRFVIVYCLFMNWLRESKAPPMPRTFFS
jgi:MFS family permease